MSKLPTVLEDIVEGRRGHLDSIRERIAHVDPTTLPRSERSLKQSLGKRGDAKFIMECKSSSPSLGLIRAEYHPGDLASIYSRYAAGISVLCEPDRFGGDYDHLATVASTTHLPVLCKDFIIDPVQIHAARYFGADAILLMLSVLDDETYTQLHAEADRLGLDVLTEVIDEEEMDRAKKLGAQIIGVNHRNLHDLSIDLQRSRALEPLVPKDVVFIAESGIRDNVTVRAIGDIVNGFLVGSQLSGQPDVDAAARELVYGKNKVCGLRSPRAAQAARAAGAVYGGLIFEEASPRNVSRETSQEIMTAEPGLKYVAVSRRESGWQELDLDGIHAVQVHAPLKNIPEEEISFLEGIRKSLPEGIQLWRAISMTKPEGPAIAQALAAQSDLVDMLVLDSGDGGTGTVFDWSEIPAVVKQRALLAGGINLNNLDEALTTGCAGLDLNSGVEYREGEWKYMKDAGALRRAFEHIRLFKENA